MNGGALIHVFLAENNPDPDALWKLTMKIAKDSLASYWAYTKDTIYCGRCDYVSGIDWKRMNLSTIADLDKIDCPQCGHKGVEVHSRITGYIQALNSSWNASKRQEWLDRARYAVGGF